MVKTRSSTACVSSVKKFEVAEKSRCADRKRKRRRGLAMPQRKNKLRRQRALQKQIAIAKSSQEALIEDQDYSQKTLRKRAAATEVVISGASNDEDDLVKDEGGRNPNFVQGNWKSNSSRCNRNPKTLPQGSCNKKARIRNPTPEPPSETGPVECSHDEFESLKHEKGWTMEQDMALQNAYFQVRPSSNFWFEVSKKVSGKTAKECFDRYYSGHPTPPITQSRSRKPAAESPVRTISFPSPRLSFDSKPHFGRGKQGLLKAHQTVRHILRQQRVADGNYEADVFSAVEKNSLLQDCTNWVTSSSPALKGEIILSESSVATPDNCLVGNGRRDNEELWQYVSLKQKAQFDHDPNQSITRLSVQGQLLSPEVLKRESNPGRLDRFLDMLHLRRVEKKKSFSVKGTTQSGYRAENRQKSEGRFTQCVSAARDAIITDAKKVLKTVLNRQAAVEEEASLLFDDVEEESSLMLEDTDSPTHG